MEQFLRFAGVGAISTILDLLVLTLTHKAGVSLGLATALGFCVGATNGYFLNSALVFSRARSYMAYGKYTLIALGGLGWTEIIVFALHSQLTVVGAKLVAVVLVSFWNFGLSKVWAFK